ncbi:MAG: hypothetical protein INR71_06305 [Terriglobus roseus]|nr:hypothetical protein [Terriglobus roseus]
MAFDLTLFDPCVRDHSDDWDALGLEWSISSIHDSHAKASVSATFETVDWLVQLTTWDSGETDMDAIPKGEGREVHTQNVLHSADDLHSTIYEILRLIRDGRPPSYGYAP